MDIEEKIKSEILSKRKDMRLDKFINNALFKRNSYYYNTKPIGSKNDFITAPEISQMFGEIISLYIYNVWENKINSEFNLIELGPGKGTLFKDIFNTLKKYPDFFKKAEVSLIEINKELIKIQKNNFGKLNLLNIYWKKSINYNSNNPSIIYSNEFFDCFPVRQFILKKYWFEKYVNINENNNFYFLEKKVTNKKLLSLLESYEKKEIFEISFERNEYFEKLCQFIKKNGGLILTIDYGYLDKISQYTLQAVQNHKYSHVLENVGKKDISSHVNFSDFIQIAKRNKLNIDEICSQQEFFIKYGILERKKILKKFKNSDIIDSQLDRLIGNDQMGKMFKCMVVSNL